MTNIVFNKTDFGTKKVNLIMKLVHQCSKCVYRYESKTDRIKTEVDKNNIIVGNLNIYLLTSERTSRHEITKDEEYMNSRVSQLDLIDKGLTTLSQKC